MLKVNDINVYYGPIHAIKGISFEVHPGEIVALRSAPTARENPPCFGRFPGFCARRRAASNLTDGTLQKPRRIRL